MRERRPKEARALAIAVARVAVRSAARLQVELDSSSIMAGDQETVQGELARRLVGYAGPGRVFFCNSGAEADEALMEAALS